MKRLLVLFLILTLPLHSCESLLGPDEEEKPPHYKLDFLVCTTADPRATNYQGGTFKLRVYGEEGEQYEYDWHVPTENGKSVILTEKIYTEKGDIYTPWTPHPSLGTGIAEVKCAVYIPRKAEGRKPSWVFTLYLGIGVPFDNMQMSGMKCSSGTIWDHQ